MRRSDLLSIRAIGRIFAPIMLVCLMLGAGQAFAQAERITDYRVAIAVRADRLVEITESITVDVRGQAIKRGLLRDIPVVYRNANGSMMDIDFDVLSIARDGQSEPFQLTHQGRYASLRIGDANIFLKHGLHTYEIRYTINHSIGFFDDYDEIYWNAIGTEWPFAIERASVTVQLPTGANIGKQYAIYTGAQGTRGDSYDITDRRENLISARTTRTLMPGEGMTVAVGWQKGIVEPPSETELAVNTLLDNSPILILALAAIAQIGWLWTAWIRVGKDPEGGAIIPRYRAPKDISPAVASYVSGLGSFEKSQQASFMAALINLAIKRFVVIDNEQDDTTVRRDDGKKRQSEDDLPPGEKALYRKLLSSKSSATFADMKYDTMAGVMGAFSGAIDEETDKVYFRRNTGYMVPGFILGIGGAIAYFFASILLAPPFFPPVAEILATAMIGAVLVLIRSLLKIIRGGSLKLLVGIGPIVFFLIIMVWESQSIATFLKLSDMTGFNWVAVPILVAVLAALIFFPHWMKAPTKLGRELLDEIEGLKLFMTVTVAEQANEAAAADMPELTPKLYEDLLPYAIALGIERQWSATFEEKVFSQLPPDQSYHPHWYRGRFDPRRPTEALSSMTQTLGTDLSSAMTPPASSSSGSGGGGFSGGGSGGGGGGGW